MGMDEKGTGGGMTIASRKRELPGRTDRPSWVNLSHMRTQ